MVGVKDRLKAIRDELGCGEEGMGMEGDWERVGDSRDKALRRGERARKKRIGKCTGKLVVQNGVSSEACYQGVSITLAFLIC